MIQILGLRRVVLLSSLMVANIALAGIVYSVLIPKKDKLTAELNETTGMIESRRSEISTMKNEYQLIQQQKALFSNLDKAKFFTTQDRVEARKMMAMIQSTARVLSARDSIGAILVLGVIFFTFSIVVGTWIKNRTRTA